MSIFDIFRRKKNVSEKPNDNSLYVHSENAPIFESISNQSACTTPEPPSIPIPPPPPKVDSKETQTKYFPSRVDGNKIKYHYDQVRVFTPKEFVLAFEDSDLGKDVSLQQEPDNTYDTRAIAVHAGNVKIGYLNRGKLQDMVNDYIDRGWPILGCIDSIEDDDNKCTICLYFYAPSEGKIYKLTGSSSKAAQEAAETLCEDDSVSIDYDFEKGKYAVYQFGEKIGYLPKSADADAEENTDFVIDHTDMNSNGKYVIFVRTDK